MPLSLGLYGTEFEKDKIIVHLDTPKFFGPIVR